MTSPMAPRRTISKRSIFALAIVDPALVGPAAFLEGSWAGNDVLTDASAPLVSGSSQWWNGLWGRPLFPPVRRRRSLRRARERSQQRSPCLSHAHRGEFLGLSHAHPAPR